MLRIHSEEEKFSIPPTMNSIEGYRLYLMGISNRLRHLMASPLSRKPHPQDIAIVLQTATYAEYTAILLEELLNKVGPRVSKHNDYTNDMERIVSMSYDPIHRLAPTETISIGVCNEIIDSLKAIIKRLRRPWPLAMFCCLLGIK